VISFLQLAIKSRKFSPPHLFSGFLGAIGIAYIKFNIGGKFCGFVSSRIIETKNLSTRF